MLKSNPRILKIFLIFTGLESAITLYLLFSISVDMNNVGAFGFSTRRLLLMGSIAMVLISAIFCLSWLLRSKENLRLADIFITSLLENDKRRNLFLITCVSLAALSALFFLTPAERVGEALYQHLFPILLLVLALAIQTLVFQFLWRGKTIQFQRFKYWHSALRVTVIVLGIFILISVWVVWSGIGIQPEASGWFSPGTPVLAQQMLLAWGMGFALLVFRKQLEGYIKLDIFIGLFLWLIAAVVWLSQPMYRWSYFTPKPTPPNFEYYPYSDSALYDEFANGLLLGVSRDMGLTHRPLYSIFIALLHALAGPKYETIITLQVMLFAFMPAAIYLLASKLGGKPAGMIAALALIFREQNSIALSNVIEVSHLKLIMSDVPTMALMALFIYFFIKWLRDPQNRLFLGALSGALLGVVILIRSQTQLLILIALLGIVVAKKDGWKPALQKIFIFLLGAFLVVIPWVWRNYQVSGRAVVEYQEFYTRIIASGYSSTPGDIDRLPNESTENYNSRMKALIVDFILENPRKVARFYLSYFMHNEISSVIYLPMTFRFHELIAYVKEKGYWSASLGSPPAGILPTFFLSVCMIALGIGTAFQRAKWVGLLPLLFHLGYSFSVVPVRMSGWRFILPVDWISVLYFSIGLMQLTAFAFLLFSEKDDTLFLQSPYVTYPTPIVWTGTVRTLAIFALFGLSLPLFEWVMPERYARADGAELIGMIAPDGFTLDNGEQVSASALTRFLETESDSTVLFGRALYPSYYEAGEFWGEINEYTAEASKYDRIQFQLIGPSNQFVFVPSLQAPVYFPNAADVFIIGCVQGKTIRGVLVKVNDQVLFSSPWRGLTCSSKD